MADPKGNKTKQMKIEVKKFEVTSRRIAIADNKLQWSIRWRQKLSGFGTEIMKP